jgi:hypothetical protein
MKTNENPNGIIQKQEEFIFCQNALIEQMKEVIFTQEKEIDYLKELNSNLEKENAFLQKYNKKIMDTVHLMLNDQYWSEIMDDVEKEHYQEKEQLLKKIQKLIDRILEVERQRDLAQDKLRERTKQYYEVATALEEEQGKNKKLTAQVNKDFENSSLPSSMKIGRKKIANSREKTDRKPGGQSGHRGYLRKQYTPTECHEIPTPKKYANNPDFKATGRTIRKQMVLLHMTMEVVELSTPEYRNIKTEQRVYAPSPEGYNDEVNYDGTVKAFAFLLGNECNVSHDKVRLFLSELTGNE